MEPEAILFRNNLGVAELNLGLLAEAEASFRTVLELHPRTDDRLRRMAPEAGARFNLGMALNASRRADEALVQIRAAMHSGSSHFARLAARRLSLSNALDVPDAEVGLIIGTALFGEGRTREASVTLARAHELAVSDELRGRIGQLMRKLADVWSVGAVPNQIRMPGALPAQGGTGKPKGVQYVRASADGTTSMEDLGELTPELLQQIKEGRVQLPPL
jgi:tetratricopeptide (TPR) repeat protein